MYDRTSLQSEINFCQIKMNVQNVFRALFDQLKTVTIEPVVMLMMFGWSIVFGSETTTNLLMWKFCRSELNYSADICANLSSVDHSEIKKEVQILVNNFSMYSSWIGTAPIILFAIIGGALSDVYGRKPLMILPIIGYLLSSIVNLTCYAFIDVLPVEFFYLNRISSFFGGYQVLWLGVYGYGTSVTKIEDRTYRLTRLNGVETISRVVGTLLSPYVFDYLGYYGNFGLCTMVNALALIYLVFFVHEDDNVEKALNVSPANIPIPSDNISGKLATSPKNVFQVSILVPLQGIKNVICKDRTTFLKCLITLQVFCSFLYSALWQVLRVTYLYMMLVFDSFTPKDYAHLMVGVAVVESAVLIFVMPILSSKLKIHDALLLAIFVGLEALSGLLKPFATSPWLFCLIYMIGAASICKNGIARSLLSKSIDSNEVGKFFSLLSITSTIGSIVGGPAFRQLYNFTLHTCPGAIFFTFAAFMFLAAFFNMFIFLKRQHLKPEEKNTTMDVKNVG